MRVLIVGLGSIARKHINVLKEIDPRVELFALRSGKHTHSEDPVISISNLDSIVGKLDFAIISNPTHLHFETIKSLVSLSCPLFIEKPVLHTLEGSDQINRLLKDKKIDTYVACNLRFHPCVVYLKQVISEGSLRINEVNVYAGSYLPEWRPAINFRDNYSSNAEMGGGAHLDLIHELDYLYWFFGTPQKVNKLLRNRSSLNISAVDYANYQLVYKDFVVNVILNYYRRDSKRTIEVLAADETIEADLIKFIVKDQTGIKFSTSINMLETYKQQMLYFLQNKNSGNLMNSFEEALEVLKICLA